MFLFILLPKQILTTIEKLIDFTTLYGILFFYLLYNARWLLSKTSLIFYLNTSHLMVFMYAIASIENGWWSDVTIIVWGSTVKLVTEDKSIQNKIELAKQKGIIVSACITCATELGVVDKLIDLGIEVIQCGSNLTQLI
jgi:hypothetical protein